MKRFSGLFSTAKTTFQILSDLYLNYESQYLTFHIPVTSPFLILAGNVGQLADYDAYLSFLASRCNLYEKVFLVLGALEFQGLSHAEGLQLAYHMEKEVATRGRLQILHRTRIDIPSTNIRLLGCTMWNRVAEHADGIATEQAPEFDTIEGIRSWTVSDQNKEHFRDLSWLRSELNDPTAPAGPESSCASTPQLIVVSSFIPDLHHTIFTWKVHPSWYAASGTDLLTGTDWSKVRYWVHGTTSRTNKTKRFGMKVVSNQRGRFFEDTESSEDLIPDKSTMDSFDVTKVIRV